ncbi:hypothetical protein [Secundilactobacillus kimchicus]|uniref:hypothetical protein n=1 Tax=Secundilactobacillus kimchicus TaxID=528209 RepID=UPI0024A97943|nr:hypothetical protein [Secundilactobacillus kimchicus]
MAKPTYYKTKGLYEVIAPQINGYRDIGFKQNRTVRFVKGTRFYAEPEKYGKIIRFKTSRGIV